MKEIIIKLSLITFSILIGFIVIETLYFFYPKKIEILGSTFRHKFSDNYDFRTKFQFYEELKKEGKDIVINVEPYHNFDSKEIFPLSSISKKLTILCNEGYFVKFMSDRYGFRNPDSEWDNKKIDYLIIGDSFGQGYCVKDKDTIAGNLRFKYDKKVLNLSMGGNGQLIQYASMKEYMPYLNAGKVILLYYEGNDLTNLEDVFQGDNRIIHKYFHDVNFKQDLINKVDEIDKILIERINVERDLYAEREQQLLMQEEKIVKRVDNEIRELQSEEKALFDKKTRKLSIIFKFKMTRSLIKNFLSNYFSKSKKFENNDINVLKSQQKIVPDKIIFSRFENIIKKMNTFVLNNNSELFFVYLPEISRYSQKRTWDKYYNYKKIIEVVKDQNIKIIDLHKELFEKTDDPLKYFPYRRFLHYNKQAYEEITDIIVNKIER